jgi:hypothetical protein
MLAPLNSIPIPKIEKYAAQNAIKSADNPTSFSNVNKFFI